MAQRTDEQVARLSKYILSAAKRAGATDCDVSITVADSVSTNVRKGEVEALRSVVQSQNIRVRTFVGDRSASVTTTDFNRRTLAATIGDCVETAREADPDPDGGLADADHLHTGEAHAGLRLFDPNILAVDPKHKTELALAAEAAALGFDKRITNSDGASFSDNNWSWGYASSRGFVGVYRRSFCTLQASVIASQGSEMQEGSWWHKTSSFDALDNPESIGQEAARRALRSLGARKVDSQKCPVVFDPRMAANLLSKLKDAADGSYIYRKSSFLVDKLGASIGNKRLTVVDDPFIPGALGSAPWGDGGLKRGRRVIVNEGVLEQYFLGDYAARKLKTVPNGGSESNLYVQAGESAPEEIIASVKNGLYLTGISGFGYNRTTGDYSLGASGLWIENGELAFPVDEITVASTMNDMLHGIEAVGNDLAMRSSVSAPTLLIGSMSIGGK
jgi:PmbA protein